MQALEHAELAMCVAERVQRAAETVVQPGTPILEIGDPLDLEIVVDALRTSRTISATI